MVSGASGLNAWLANHGQDVAASVRRRLLNHAKATSRPFNELLQHYAMERFLHRLSISTHADRFILKGALLRQVWQAPAARPTMEIDLLGRTSNDPAAPTRIVQDLCRQSAAAAGLQFDADTVAAQAVAEEADYHGVRVRFRGSLGTARITMQIDVGLATS